MNIIDIIHTEFPGFRVNKASDRLRRKYNVSRSTMNNWIKVYSEECILDDEKTSPLVYEE